MAEKSKLDAALDELLAGKSTEEIVGQGGVLKQLTKALLERAMGAELSNHLGYEKHDSAGWGSGNSHNCFRTKAFIFQHVPIFWPYGDTACKWAARECGNSNWQKRV